MLTSPAGLAVALCLLAKETDVAALTRRSLLVTQNRFAIWETVKRTDHASHFPDPFVARVLLQTYYGRATGRFARAVCS